MSGPWLGRSFCPSAQLDIDPGLSGVLPTAPDPAQWMLNWLSAVTGHSERTLIAHFFENNSYLWPSIWLSAVTVLYSWPPIFLSAVTDHSTVETDYSTSVMDHSTAVTDYSTSVMDHSTAVTDP